MCTEYSDNPDLRDRGYLYWRLLSTDPELAKQIVLCDKPEVFSWGGGMDKGNGHVIGLVPGGVELYATVSSAAAEKAM